MEQRQPDTVAVAVRCASAAQQNHKNLSPMAERARRRTPGEGANAADALRSFLGFYMVDVEIGFWTSWGQSLCNHVSTYIGYYATDGGYLHAVD
jgi:hypothetical protein